MQVKIYEAAKKSSLCFKSTFLTHNLFAASLQIKLYYQQSSFIVVQEISMQTNGNGGKIKGKTLCRLWRACSGEDSQLSGITDRMQQLWYDIGVSANILWQKIGKR